MKKAALVGLILAGCISVRGSINPQSSCSELVEQAEHFKESGYYQFAKLMVAQAMPYNPGDSPEFFCYPQRELAQITFDETYADEVTAGKRDYTSLTRFAWGYKAALLELQQSKRGDAYLKEKIIAKISLIEAERQEQRESEQYRR